MSSAVIIVAAGKGNRFKSKVPKQFQKLGKHPVFLWSILAFKRIKEFSQIIVVVPQDYMNKLKSLAGKYDIELVPGGKERVDSVKAGLDALQSNIEYVAIHDAARPLVDKDTILNCLRTAKKIGSAIVAVPTKDTVKKAGKSMLIEKTIPRDTVWLAQTPQIFKKSIILEAYSKKLSGSITDDSYAVENTGRRVRIVAGKNSNFKITVLQDMKTAEFLLREKVDGRR